MKFVPTILVILTALILFGWFWFEYRPSQIRTECESVRREWYANRFNSLDNNKQLNEANKWEGDIGDGYLPSNIAQEVKDDAETRYMHCLREKGL